MGGCHLADGVTLQALTRGPKHHFFGYYDKCPFDISGRFVLAQGVSFIDRPPRPGDEAALGMADLQRGGEFTVFDTTHAWNWQQGTMLQWLPQAASTVVYNVRDDDAYRAVVRDVASGTARKLPLSIHALSPDGKSAVTVNYARLAVERPGYGYVGLPDPFVKETAPRGDGLWHIDIASGKHRLLVSLAQLADVKPAPSMANATHRVYHAAFGPDSKRILFLHRWQKRDMRHTTRLFTVNADGSDLYLLNDHEMTSHYCWLDDQRILAWARQADRGDHYYVFHDRQPRVDMIGDGVLTSDGHCTPSPDGKWILTDTYPIKSMRTLILYHLASGRRIDVGGFFSPPAIDGEIRCDLHPRFNRDGTQICIDSVHDGERQMYALDVSSIVRG